jgi:hypothetical protein
MKTSLLILTTEAVAEVLHDEHALTDPKSVIRDAQAHLIITMWRGKVGKPQHAEECQRWRFIADKFTNHLNQWLKASGVPVAEPQTEVSFSLASATRNVDDCLRAYDAMKAERDEREAKLLDTTAAAALHAERAARLQTELDRTRAHETHLIQERDRLIHQDLAGAHQRERLLSERLANIAAFSSGS